MQSAKILYHYFIAKSMDCADLIGCKDRANSSSFYRLVYSQIEEIGWEHLVKLSEDLTFLSFRIIDKKERTHIMEIQLEKSYPQCPPSVSASITFFGIPPQDVPYIFTLEWSTKSRLKDVLQQFQKHLERLQEFWSIMDDVDRTLWIVEPKVPSRSMSSRMINIGNDSFIILTIDADDPRALPECRFIGTDAFITLLTKKWRQNSKRWRKEKTVPENIAFVLETDLPKSPASQIHDQQTECGICYAHYLPSDDELGAKSGSGTDYLCDNSSCNRAFHSVCLGDWLRSISTTRQSFNVLFGNCPYCSEAVAVKINDNK